MAAPRPEKLRAAIDRGATGDKVRVSDPAAAPLGTDEEAAGTPVRPEAVEQALRDETRTIDRGRPRREFALPPSALVLLGGALLVGFVLWWLT